MPAMAPVSVVAVAAAASMQLAAMVAEPRALALLVPPVCARPQSVVTLTISAVPQADQRMSAGTHLLIADLSQAATIAPIAQTAVHPTVAALPTAAAHRIAVVAVVEI